MGDAFRAFVTDARIVCIDRRHSNWPIDSEGSILFRFEYLRGSHRGDERSASVNNPPIAPPTATHLFSVWNFGGVEKLGSFDGTVVLRYHDRAMTTPTPVHQNTSVGQMMNTNTREAYRAAFDEASLELKQIFGRIEQLRMRKRQIEKVVEVLGRKIGVGETMAPVEVRRKTHLAGLTVVTRLTAVQSNQEAGK
jgi:hypothetical protein